MERKIVDYTIISKQSSTEISKTINRLLVEGWQPFGDLKVVSSGSGSVLFYSDETVFTQVMVKYQD